MINHHLVVTGAGAAIFAAPLFGELRVDVAEKTEGLNIVSHDKRGYQL